ncbi:MAG TPA: SDR family NAD(P)-dependent oxidoreductase [Caulobacteraceae bacterium]|jgi:NAD(P)-dependent dehydrogenase (short-subunit alcohol dehydrogenase family)|nr:SDR family NAD(P)-dependent oxidoreductase [Caulobacteraceae bacterium]
MTDASDSKPLSGRLALVTGASRGIGRSTAQALAKAGAHVIAAARTQGALEELDDEIKAATGESATLTPFDITDGEAIDRLGGALWERFKRLDVVVHCAGRAGTITPVSHMSPKDFDAVIATNLTSTYRLIRSFEPLLRASDSGRFIMLSSGVAVKTYPFFGAYSASKAGVEALIRCWAVEVDTTPLRTAIVSPGPMRTKMRAEAFPGEDPMTLPHPDEIGPLIVELARGDREPPKETVQFAEWKAAHGAPVH